MQVQQNRRRGASIVTPFVNPGPLDTFESHSASEEMRKKAAIKCDLCAGYKDQACREACPVGASVRIQLTRFFGSTEEILRRRMKKDTSDTSDTSDTNDIKEDTWRWQLNLHYNNSNE